MIEFILPLILGLLAGIFTGLIPGIHINLISTAIISIPILQKYSTINLIIFIVAMATTHTFLDFIPSIYFGAPSSDTALCTLPGHKFLSKRLGHYAIKLTVIGSTIAILSLIIIIPIFIFILPEYYSLLQQMMAFILIWISIFLIYSEKNKINSLIIFILAGFLGISSLNISVEQPILPMLTGLFATSNLINSIKNKTKIPKQILLTPKIKKSDLIKPTMSTILISPICSLLPGLGSSQAAIISSKFSRRISKSQFLILLGSINTLVMTTSFLTLYFFQKSRTGTAQAISNLITLTSQNLKLIFLIIILSSLLSIPLALLISKLIAKNIHKISYSKISIIILIFLIIINFYFTGFLGLLILVVSTLLGLSCINLNVKKSFLMGCLLIPTIIYYLP